MGKPKTPPPPPPNACIQCMKRSAAPHNGGLCEVCAPPLNVPRLREFIELRRLVGAAAARAWLAASAPGSDRYGLGA